MRLLDVPRESLDDDDDKVFQPNRWLTFDRVWLMLL